MPRWKWFLPFGILMAVLAYNGVKLGIERAGVTESDVINFYAERYLEDHRRIIGSEAALTDCIAVPGGETGVWIEVRCQPQGGEPAFLYGANRAGAQVYAARDGEVPEA